MAHLNLVDFRARKVGGIGQIGFAVIALLALIWKLQILPGHSQ